MIYTMVHLVLEQLKPTVLYILTPVVVTSKVNDHLRPQSRSLDGPSFLVANQPGGGNVVVGNGLAESLMHSIGIFF